MPLEKTDALVIVDVQRDFCAGGSLAVPEGDQVVPVLRRYLELFEAQELPVVYTRDWHPSDHCSFRPQGGPWPVHCVAGSPGAEFHPGLPVSPRAVVISKPSSAGVETYSAFQGTRLKDELASRGVRRLLVGGLATDYCVRWTLLDGLREGFRTALLLDAVRAVEVKPGDGRRAIEEMAAAGAELYRLENLAGASLPPGGPPGAPAGSAGQKR